MTQNIEITRKSLRTPRAAAIAGIAFALLLGTALVMLRIAIPANPRDAGTWLNDPWRKDSVLLALNLVPFAGLAFLWFIGAVRDRIGAAEDRFFATVFLGTGLLFVGMLFVAAAIAGGLFSAEVQRGTAEISPEVWRFGRHTTYLVVVGLRHADGRRVHARHHHDRTSARHPPPLVDGARRLRRDRAPAHGRVVRVGRDLLPHLGAHPQRPLPRPTAARSRSELICEHRPPR